MARVSDGKTVRRTAPAGGVVKDEFYRVGGFNGFAMQSADAAEEFAMEIDPRAVHRFDIGAGVAAAAGDVLYMPPAGGNATALTATAAGNVAAIKVTLTKDADNIIEGYAIND